MDDDSQDAVPEDLPHQEDPRQEGEAEQAHPSLDSLQNGQQDSLQREEEALAPH